MLSWKVLTGVAAAAGVVTAGTIGITAAAASPEQPPEGARAVVHVNPNPVTSHEQKITITGNCGGGSGLKAVVGNSPEHSTLTDVRIVDRDPAHFFATARLAGDIGSGVGPVLVDCGGEAGVTLMVTRL